MTKFIIFIHSFFLMTEDKFTKEVEIQKFWEKNNIYEKAKEKNKGLKPFNFIDGPPFPTGDIHLGHLRNWSIKDAVLRFKRLQNYDVYARDGYDVQGLPVENKVQAKLGLKTSQDLRDFGEENFISECRTFVDDVISDMEDVRNRFGLWMNRDAYRTSHPEYLSMAWQFFKKAEEKNLLYKDYKTVAWCPNDETTLSDYEIKDTYKILSDPSVYIKFPLMEEFRTTKYEESLVIWTTTPWTLQSNMAIAVNAKYKYAKALVEINSKKQVLILAESLVESVIDKFSKFIDIKFIKILETLSGADLEGVRYNHIYLDETPSQQDFVKLENRHIHSVVLADFVTLDEGEDIFEKLEKKGYKHSNSSKSEEKIVDVKKKEVKSEGSGLVHIAPGHGFDDYDVGKKFNLPIFCPINAKGVMVEGKYKDMYFKDIDPIAIDYLKEKGFLLYSAMKEHRYPCCWRCKTPIVYRAADQWWIKRGDYTKEIVKENNNVHWTPNSAKTAFNNLIGGAGDWAISRQRYWGIPIPVWEDEDGNYEVFGSKDELEERIGRKLNDIHRDDIKDIEIVNKKSGKIMKSVPFIADVWFDSGCASFASHYGEGLSFDEIIKKYYPIKWITEGEDQIRGWFSSLFNVGYVLTGKAPYNEVLYYRYVMDKQGVKMSKSLGNGITGNDAINTWGADKTRYYLLTKTVPEDQLNFNEDEFDIVNGFFNTLENLTKFMDSYLGTYEFKSTSLNFNTLDVEDRWILYKLNRTIGTYTRLFEKFKFNQALRELEDFIVRDLSKTYLKLVKDRTDGRDNDLLMIFSEILKKVQIMLSVVIPFKSEELYQLCNFANKRESIFLEDMPECDDYILTQVEKAGIAENFDLAQDVVAAVLNAREKVKIGVRWPLGQIDILGVDIEHKLKVFKPMICKLTNIAKISYDTDGVEMSYNIKPNFATLKVDFKENMSDVIKLINQNKMMIAEGVAASMSGDKLSKYEIDYSKHIISEMIIDGDFVSSDFASGNVILHTAQDDVLLEEGYLRELIRRIQQARKELGLNKTDEITLSFDGSDNYFIELTLNWGSVICKKVGATEIVKGNLTNKFEHKIKDKSLVVYVKN